MYKTHALVFHVYIPPPLYPPLRKKYLLDLVDSTLADLESSGCIAVEEDFITTPTILGYIASYYYLDYRSVGLIKSSFLDMEEVDYESVTKLLSDAKVRRTWIVIYVYKFIRLFILIKNDTYICIYSSMSTYTQSLPCGIDLICIILGSSGKE